MIVSRAARLPTRYLGRFHRLSTASSHQSSELELKKIVNQENGSVIGVVTLNRPKRMNALSFEMGEKLLQLPQELKAMGARALVLTGSGKAFSTGRDLKDSKQHNAEEAHRYMSLARDTVLAMKASEIPTVAAINGFAFGWGMEMALACDLRVVAKDATLCFPETRLGIFPGAAGTVLLPRVVGPAIAKDLILTARQFKGEEAFQLHLANRLTSSPEEALQVATDLASTIASNGPLGVKGARIVIDNGLDMTFEEHVNLSNKHRFPLNDTEDFAEALQAFEEKRVPVFKGK